MHHEKTCLPGFRPCPTQTGLYRNRIWLEPRNFGLCTCCVAKTKMLINCAAHLHLCFSHLQKQVLSCRLLLIKVSLYPPQTTMFVGGYTVFTLSERPTERTNDRVSVTFCFLNILKNH